mgnify:CR=1 FL=1
MFPEYSYHNPLQDPEVCRDAFGDEVYEGDTVWCGDEGMLPDPGTDNYDSKNPVMDLIVQQLGTRYILEQLGYEKRIIE